MIPALMIFQIFFLINVVNILPNISLLISLTSSGTRVLTLYILILLSIFHK